ncbi:FAD-dependent oxidoreductase [Nonomuraea terrae]|uniref:FAD-dependent oxidoreductase n=1 Tax=Nonomuraea terrae TaxID=2530383 RepID=UPI001FE53459|nr:FAD-dependent oxidoreductase [Nonomuraea terrae]
MTTTMNSDGTDARSSDDGGCHVVVVGAGAPGLNAALVLRRVRREVVVIDAGEPRNAPAAHMHGLLSRDRLPPATLLERGRAEIARYGVRLVRGRVENIDHGFPVRMEGWCSVPPCLGRCRPARRAA